MIAAQKIQTEKTVQSKGEVYSIDLFVIAELILHCLTASTNYRIFSHDYEFRRRNSSSISRRVLRASQ